MVITIDLEDQIAHIRRLFGNSADLSIRRFNFTPDGRTDAVMIYIEGLNEPLMIASTLESVTRWLENIQTRKVRSAEQWKTQLLHAPFADTVVDAREDDQVSAAILSGSSLILFAQYPYALTLNTKGGEQRSVDEPETQSLVRGPREGFTESLRTNTSLIRRRIQDTRLRVENRKIGAYSHTDIAILYIDGLADDSLVEEVRRRLDQIDIDAILESAYIEEFIQDETMTPFPTIFSTERPDVTCAAILEGRVAIICNGTPFVLMMPALFVSFFQTAEDYYHRSDFGLLRLLRLLAFGIAVLAPSFYIALTTFHQEMLPTQLLISLAAQREGIPFPAFIEAMILESTFEILREAGIRMPKTVGQAVSIVGAIVLGEAAVAAGLVSPAMVIVVSLTAIANFTIPQFDMAIAVRIIRFGYMMLAASFGLFGISIGVVLLAMHLCSLTSFGVPYMSPLAPMQLSDQKDTLLRMPMWMMRTRPHGMALRNKVRMRTKK